MKYNLHYDRLMERAKNRIIKGIYVEKHHIIPRCMGGTDSLTNIAELTPEEHFVAHQLLVKMHPDNRKLILALSKMCSNSSKNPRNNKWYGWIRKQCSKAFSGENNPNSKFTNNEVLDIYYSNDTIDDLARQYNVIRYNIITIKRKIYYRSVTNDIKDLPGFCETDVGKGKTFPWPIDFVEDIFYDTGDYAYFWEKYRVSAKEVRSIKSKRTYKKITSKLDIPGQVKRYGLTQSMVDEVYEAVGTNSEIATQYGIHYNTVRNIKGSYSRAFNMWEEF